ncbi:MAG: alpha/beta fold hydrolase [Muribaculaceae bacterium]
MEKYIYDINGEGTPVVFLHGLGGDRQQWQKLLEAHSGIKGFFPDLPGHGDNGEIPDEGFSFDSLCHWTAGFIDTVIGTPCAVAGISMGACMALKMAMEMPEMVTKVLAVRPAWTDSARPDNLEMLHIVGEQWRSYGAEKARALISTSQRYMEMLHHSEACAASVMGQFGRKHPEAATASLVAMTDDAPVADIGLYGGIRVPVMVVGNDADPMHPLYMARTLAAAIPEARLEVIASRYCDGNRHRLQLNALIAEFLG